jgi:hypothetical protein
MSFVLSLLLAASALAPAAVGAQAVARVRPPPRELHRVTVERIGRDYLIHSTGLGLSSLRSSEMGTAEGLFETETIRAPNSVSAIDHITSLVGAAEGDPVLVRLERGFTPTDASLFAKSVNLAGDGRTIISSRLEPERLRDLRGPKSKYNPYDLSNPPVFRFWPGVEPESRADFSREPLHPVAKRLIEQGGDNWHVYEFRTRVPDPRFTASGFTLPVRLWIRIKESFAGRAWDLLQNSAIGKALFGTPGSSGEPTLEAVGQVAERSLRSFDQGTSFTDAVARVKADLKEIYGKYYLNSVEMTLQVGDITLVLVPVRGPDGSRRDHDPA